MPFAVAAGVAAVGTIAGAAISANAAGNAAQDQENAAMNATQAQLSMFDTTQANYKPQIQLGQGAANLLSTIYGTGNGGNGTPNYSAFDNSPGYKFSVQQGQSAINKAAAASGNLYSSNTLGALSNFNTGAASTQYNSYINQLLSMAGLGNAAASGVGSAATATGAGIANSYTNAGNAAANGALGQANAFSNALGSGNSGLSGMLSSYLQNGGGSPTWAGGYGVGNTSETAGGGTSFGYDSSGIGGIYDSSGNMII
jgi:hypothetical protein